jgi:hypothetical protein
MSPAQEEYRVIVTEGDLKTCIIEVSLHKNARAGLYALFELGLSNFPLRSEENLPLLRSQLENRKMSATTIPRGVTNVKRWLLDLFREAYGRDSSITILQG